MNPAHPSGRHRGHWPALATSASNLEPGPDQPTEPSTDDRKGRMRIAPTSDQPRRVAESRLEQGLPPRIDNPAVIESLALFLRNALKTLDRDQNDRPAQETP
ncbi:hypothetical protein ABIA39_000288 [Nocardia sp. GAS34]|uniref:hypothetical protein n=1 Tax=unclassified Nocardia TaxID=2637762 RepID=UPI003D1BD416